MGFLNWDKFDEKMRARATEELLRFMTLFASAAAMVCFFANLLSDGDMTFPLVLLTFMMVMMICWQYKKRKNDRRWGYATRTGKEIFRIGMNQPTAEEQQEPKTANKKKKKQVKKGNYKR